MDEQRLLGELGHRMRLARLATYGPVQKACADALKVTQSQISRWESGQSLPRVTELIRFAEACNTTLEELVGESKPVPRQLLLGLEPAAQGAIVDLVEIIKKKTLEASRLRKRRTATGGRR